jgi:hypothetical protein
MAEDDFPHRGNYLTELRRQRAWHETVEKFFRSLPETPDHASTVQAGYHAEIFRKLDLQISRAETDLALAALVPERGYGGETDRVDAVQRLLAANAGKVVLPAAAGGGLATIMPTRERLAAQIEADPDLETEARPAAADTPAPEPREERLIGLLHEGDEERDHWRTRAQAAEAALCSANQEADLLSPPASAGMEAGERDRETARQIANRVEKAWHGAFDDEIEPTVASALANARSEGKAEMRERVAKWHEERGRVAAPGTGGTFRHEWYAQQIRALPTDPAQKDPSK